MGAWAVTPPPAPTLLCARTRVWAAAERWPDAAADARTAVDAAADAATAADAALRLGVALLVTPDSSCRDAAGAAAALAAAVARTPRGGAPALVATLAAATAALPGPIGASIVEATRSGNTGTSLHVRVAWSEGGTPPRARVRAVLATAAHLPPSAVAIDAARGTSLDATLTCSDPDATLTALQAGVSAVVTRLEGDEKTAAPPPLALTIPTPTALAPAPPPRPRLVTADGRPIMPSGPRSALGLSRVVRHARDADTRAWVESSDSAVRWRQSAGEVTIIVVGVGAGVPAASLAVKFGTHSVAVWQKQGGGAAAAATTPRTLLWRGDLHRMIVPSECAWTHGGGTGEDGCVLHIAKANLEAWADPAKGGAATWWPALLAGPDGAAATAVEWDAYDKDYSDAPPPVAEVAEGEDARAASERARDAADRELRRVLREEDAARRRARQVALHELRWGTAESWAALTCGREAPWKGARVLGKENV